MSETDIEVGKTETQVWIEMNPSAEDTTEISDDIPNKSVPCITCNKPDTHVSDESDGSSVAESEPDFPSENERVVTDDIKVTTEIHAVEDIIVDNNNKDERVVVKSQCMNKDANSDKKPRPHPIQVSTMCI